MKKHYCIFERVVETDGSISIRKTYIMGKKLEFHTYEEAINYMNSNPHKFLENIEYFVWEVFVRDEEAFEFNKIAI